MKSTGTHILYVSYLVLVVICVNCRIHLRMYHSQLFLIKVNSVLCLILLLMVLIQKLFRFYESLLFVASRWPDEVFVKCSATSFNSNSAAFCSFPNWSHFHNLDTGPDFIGPMLFLQQDFLLFLVPEQLYFLRYNQKFLQDHSMCARSLEHAIYQLKA